MHVLETFDLGKSYGGRTVLDGFNLRVRPGEVCGLIGANGAGKTTAMRLMLGLARPDRGQVRLFGRDLKQEPRLVSRVGSLVETPGFYGSMSAADNLRLFVRLHGGTGDGRLHALLELFGLSEAADRPVSSFSLGMKQRLGIARALLHQPDLVILDEPSNGMDPHGMRMMRHALRRLAKEQNMAILVSSHLLGELERTADRAVMLRRGGAFCTLERGDWNREHLSLGAHDARLVAHRLKEEGHRLWRLPSDRLLVLQGAAHRGRIGALMAERGADHGDLQTIRISLEDWFLWHHEGVVA